MATAHYEFDCGFDDDDERRGREDCCEDSVGDDVHRSHLARRARRPRRNLHRLAEVRRQQGVTLRNVARRLGLEMQTVRHQEHPDSDVRISEILMWQQVLEVPLAELLVEGEGQLSGPILERSRMVKLMKTAAAIRERTKGTPLERMVEMLVAQILEIMPELEDVTPWHTVGTRRTLDELGRTASRMVSEDVFRLR